MTPTTHPSTPFEVLLWPDGAPGSEGQTGAEIWEPGNAEHDYLKVWNIHCPSLIVYRAPQEIATGAAMIVAPGGAHRFLAIDIEGYNVAEYLNSIGVTALVLKYRLGGEKGSPYKPEVHAWQDAQRAIRLVRSRATEWGINPSRVGIMGFSAGAHVTWMASTRFDAGQPDAADPVERESSRPDLQVLIYGGGALGRRGFSTRGHGFAADTPPTFLLGADDDWIAAQMPGLYLALHKLGVSAELHMYATGGHGFGIRKPPKPLPSASTWQMRLADWLGDRGMLKR